MRTSRSIDAVVGPSPTIEADLAALARWSRRRLAQARPLDVTLLLAFGGLFVWSLVGNYVGLLGLPALSGADAATPIYLVGVALLCVAPLTIVLAFFVLPRWDRPGIDRPEPRWLAWAKPGVPALGMALCPWIDPVPVILTGTFLLIGTSAWTAAAAGRDRRWLNGCEHLLLELPGAVLTLFWMVVWIEIWVRAAMFWFPHIAQPFQIGALAAVVVAGWLLHVAVRRADRRGAIAAVTLVLAGLGLSNPGVPAVMAGALYMLNIGGGRIDIEASGEGPLLCDMGAFGRHYYVRAGRDGCTFESASRWIGTLREKQGPARVRFLRASRITVASPAQPG